MKEHVSEEKQVPFGYWRIGEPPVELHDIVENLWAENLLPSFESLPSQITLTPELNDLLNSEFTTASERKEGEATINFLYSPSTGVLAGGRKRRGFGGRSQRGPGKTTLEKHNAVFLGIIRPHPYREEALFNQDEIIYFLKNPRDLFIVAVAKEGVRLAIKSQETSSKPDLLKWYRLSPLFLQYYKFCETDCFKVIKQQHPEISGIELKRTLHRQTESAFNLKVAQEFSLGLYSSSEENPEILKGLQ